MSTTDADDRRRHELAQFLRSRRARSHPADLGLPLRRRRRTDGLRREDVAQLAGVSVAWYTNLEQGRSVNPSKTVIAGLATALRLDGADRDYLYRLAGHTPPPTSGHLGPDAAMLQALVDRVDAPVYCTDALTNVLAWNAPAVAVFGDYAAWPPPRRNLLTLLFGEAGFGDRLVDRDDYAARVVRTFRGRSDAYLHDPTAIQLVDTLVGTSEAFAALWRTADVRRADTDLLAVDLPEGRREFTMVVLQALSTTGVRFNAYLPR